MSENGAAFSGLIVVLRGGCILIQLGGMPVIASDVSGMSTGWVLKTLIMSFFSAPSIAVISAGASISKSPLPSLGSTSNGIVALSARASFGLITIDASC